LIFSLVKSDIVKFIFNFFYYVIPKPGEIKDVTVALIMGQDVPLWQGVVNEAGITGPSWLSVITSVVFCLALFSYSVYYFSKKDY
jgi:hypothetical protein